MSSTSKVIVTKNAFGVIVVPEIISVDVEERPVEVVLSSPGPQGPPGPPGPGGDAYFEMDFVNASTVMVDHNLSMYPSVTIMIAGVAVEADVHYNSLNSLTVVFGAPYTGKVACS